MSGPPPVVIEFALKNFDKVLKAMNSIQDVVTKTERQSVVAAKAGKSARQKVLDEEVKHKIAAYRRADSMANAAFDASLKKSEKRHRAEAAAIRKAAEEKIAAYKRADKIVEQSYKDTEKRLHGIREKSAAMAGAFAKKQADTELSIRRKLLVERNRADQEIRRGGNAMAQGQQHLSPQARKVLIDSAKGKSLEEQKAIAEKANRFRQEAQIERAKYKRSETDQDAHQRRMTKKAETEEKKRQALLARADAETQRRREQFNKKVLDAGGSAVHSATSVAARVVGGVGRGVMNVGGGFSLEDSVQRRLRMRGNLADISNRAIIPGDKENASRVSVNALQSQVNAVGTRYAIDPETATAGLDKFAAKTGNLSRGRELLSGLAEMSRAGGPSLPRARLARSR
jgi:hypothetical protein